MAEARGPLLAITPFNFPINLALHKIAPAWAAGCPVVLKPSPKAALTGLLIADLASACELPEGMLSVIQTDNELAQRLIKDSRITQISFAFRMVLNRCAITRVVRPFISLESASCTRCSDSVSRAEVASMAR